MQKILRISLEQRAAGISQVTCLPGLAVRGEVDVPFRARIGKLSG
jgi:hypothetical protein